MLQPHTALEGPGYIQLFQSFVGAFGNMVVWFPRWVYRGAAVALMGLIALSADLRRNLIAIVQGRYLLPLLPLFGALLALAARGAGERWGRAAGVAIVSGAVALSLFGQLLTVAWFYS